MKIILIGNYPQDRQESMERFAQMLHTGFQTASIESEIWRPQVLLGAQFKTTTSGIGKWFGYLDKWILFPILLRWRLLDSRFNRADVRFHVCDHSNSPYLAHLPADKTSITCHDVLAIRGALGYADAYCPASGFGKILQKWILSNLSRAKRIACVSQLTLDQLDELTAGRRPEQADWRVVHNAFNADFDMLDRNETDALLNKLGVSEDSPFLLHVGSRLPRKNRKMLLDMVHALGNRWGGRICFAGQPIDDELRSHAQSLGLEKRVVSVEKPNHLALVALYNACEAFVFPSFSEGFGWPVIEAQACGAPVIASDVKPLPEVSGGAAFHADPAEPSQFAEALLALQDQAIRQKIVQDGLENCRRFEPSRMINSYLKLYGLKYSLSA
ncbi:glycosyltransferase family 1 protein [Spirosoma sp. KNUC1025]|uniref:glycosyltransferase family 4 protein n=1 Tax=Spirosoma sp. KNUC1025 TaxID=2894082 RepID=UPI003864D81A|nr:glycosyltransferase family 4 protein [Spirosoma sp. KNUC1025]